MAMEARIKEIKKALENNMAEAALALTLTLPDICGQVAEPNESRVGKRYKNWLINNIPKDAFDVNYDSTITSICGGNDPQFPTLTAEDIYELRCHFLHSGDAEITNINLDYFVLKKIGAGDYTDNRGIGVRSGYTCYIEKDINGNECKHFEIDTGYLCEVIVDAATKYYNDSADKNAFKDHSIKLLP